MKNIVFVFLMLFGIFAHAQAKSTPYFVFNVGYDYWNGNYGRLGSDLYLVQKNDNIITISGNVNLGYMRDKFRAIPEIGIGYLFNFKNNTGDPYSSHVSAPFYSTRVDISPWTIAPKVGITILSIIELNAGYSFEFRENKDFKDMDGVRAGLIFHLPSQLF